MPINRGTLAYFWFEKGDMSRYVDYDEATIRDEWPELYQAIINHRLAVLTIDALLEAHKHG